MLGPSDQLRVMMMMPSRTSRINFFSLLVHSFREAMHGDAARTAALLLMIACSTDAPAAIRCPG